MVYTALSISLAVGITAVGLISSTLFAIAVGWVNKSSEDKIAESVDMMRVLEHGMKVKMVPTKHQSYAVDTQEDLNKVEKLMKD